MLRLNCLFVTLMLMNGTTVVGQEKTPPKKKEAPEPYPGYKKFVIEGFTLHVNKDVLDPKNEAYERKPLDVLKLELGVLTKALSAKALQQLQKMIIWVEWDEKDKLANGRAGFALAVYQGSSQNALMSKGKNPGKAKTVTVLSMKGLTEEHQPQNDSERCVLMHEFAHAVHDQVFGFENEAIKKAYQQAMERKLYDKSLYAATNEKEFFAELTCSYLDILEAYPHNRDDLRKHDLVTFKLMEDLWGKNLRVRPTTPKITTKLPPDGRDKFDMDVTIQQMKIGEVLNGPKLADPTFKGKVALITFWHPKNASSLSALAKLTKWDNDLRRFGYCNVIGTNFQAQPVELKQAAEARHWPFSLVDPLLPPAKIGFKNLPHSILFDHRSKCVFRGTTFDLEPHLRMTIGKSLVAQLDQKEFNKSVVPIIAMLEKGQSPSTVLQSALPLASSSDAAVSEDAKRVARLLLEGGKKTIEEAEAFMKEKPVDAFVMLEPLPLEYKMTSVATRSTELLAKLRSDKAVIAELRARPTLEQIRKLDTALSGQAGSFDPTSPKFQMDHAETIKQIKKELEKIKKLWPAAHATQEATQIVDQYVAQ
jgi:hypothetical protein